MSVQVAVEAEVYRGAPELREQVMTSLLAHLLSRLSTQLLDLLPREALCHCNVLMWLGAVSCASAWLQAGVRARSTCLEKEAVKGARQWSPMSVEQWLMMLGHLQFIVLAIINPA